MNRLALLGLLMLAGCGNHYRADLAFVRDGGLPKVCRNNMALWAVNVEILWVPPDSGLLDQAGPHHNAKWLEPGLVAVRNDYAGASLQTAEAHARCHEMLWRTTNNPHFHE